MYIGNLELYYQHPYEDVATDDYAETNSQLNCTSLQQNQSFNQSLLSHYPQKQFQSYLSPTEPSLPPLPPTLTPTQQHIYHQHDGCGPLLLPPPISTSSLLYNNEVNNRFGYSRTATLDEDDKLSLDEDSEMMHFTNSQTNNNNSVNITMTTTTMTTITTTATNISNGGNNNNNTHLSSMFNPYTVAFINNSPSNYIQSNPSHHTTLSHFNPSYSVWNTNDSVHHRMNNNNINNKYRINDNPSVIYPSEQMVCFLLC